MTVPVQQKTEVTYRHNKRISLLFLLLQAPDNLSLVNTFSSLARDPIADIIRCSGGCSIPIERHVLVVLRRWTNYDRLEELEEYQITRVTLPHVTVLHPGSAIAAPQRLGNTSCVGVASIY